MTIRIEPGKPISPSVEGTSLETTAVSKSETPAENDPVTRIAEELAVGHITPNEAVDQLITHTLHSDTVGVVPESLRQEMKTVLEMMIETDPHLQALCSRLE